MWDTLAEKVFQNSLHKTLSAAWLICGLQLTTTALLFWVMFRASRLAAPASEAVAAALRTGMGIALLAAPIFIVTTFILVRGLRHLCIRPLAQVDTLFEKLAAGQNDLSQEMTQLPYAELSHVADGYNVFMGRIRDIIEQVRSMGIRIASTAHGCARG